MIYSETLLEFELGSVHAVVKAEADGKFSPQTMGNRGTRELRKKYRIASLTLTVLSRATSGSSVLQARGRTIA